MLCGAGTGDWDDASRVAGGTRGCHADDRGSAQASRSRARVRISGCSRFRGRAQQVAVVEAEARGPGSIKPAASKTRQRGTPDWSGQSGGRRGA